MIVTFPQFGLCGIQLIRNVPIPILLLGGTNLFAKISLLLLVRNDVINELPANCNGCKNELSTFQRAFDTMLLLNANLAPQNLFLAHLIEYQVMFLFSSAERGINLFKQIGRDLSKRWVLLSDLITIHPTKSPLFDELYNADRTFSDIMWPYLIFVNFGTVVTNMSYASSPPTLITLLSHDHIMTKYNQVPTIMAIN